ncbi:unnamed protein product, partial [marine sediment metagenome]
MGNIHATVAAKTTRYTGSGARNEVRVSETHLATATLDMLRKIKQK